MRLTPIQIARLAQDYEAGTTVYELSNTFKISRQTVSAHLKREGIDMRGRSPDAATVDVITTLYRSGLSLEKVGDHVGCSARTVQRYLRARGVVTRDSHGRPKAAPTCT